MNPFNQIDLSHEDKSILKYYFIKKNTFISTLEVAKELELNGPSSINPRVVGIAKRYLRNRKKSPSTRNDGNNMYWNTLFDGQDNGSSFYWKLKDDIYSELKLCNWINDDVCRKSRFYIIGSKYRKDTGEWYSIYQDLIDNEVVAIGFAWNENLIRIKNSPINSQRGLIAKFLTDPKQQIKTLRFINLKPGDVIAIKSGGNFSDLKICGYAIVKGLGDSILASDNVLGHTISVEHLIQNVDYYFPYHKAETIHEVTIDNEIENIFEPVLSELFINNFLIKNGEINREISEVDSKNTHQVNLNYQVDKVLSRKHNLLQNNLKNALVANNYENVMLEKNNIDLQYVDKRTNEKCIVEVKPYDSPTKCMREALGQILYYGSKIKEEQIKYIIVGPSAFNESDEIFALYLKEILGVSLDYYSKGEFITMLAE